MKSTLRIANQAATLLGQSGYLNKIRMAPTDSIADLDIVSSDSFTDSRTIGARFRQPRVGPERDLLDDFIGCVPLNIPKGCRVTLLREPRLDSGFPDLVIVVWREDKTKSWAPSRASLQAFDLRILHLLYERGCTNSQSLIDQFGRRVVHSLERLSLAEMVDKEGESWKPRDLDQTFAAEKIVAVEAKLTDWKRVLAQAIVNTWFASASYVLLPTAARPQYRDAAKRCGIGICWFEGDNVEEVKGRCEGLPRSYASWLLAEWAWRSTRVSGIE